MKVLKVFFLAILIIFLFIVIFGMGYPFRYYINNYKLSKFAQRFEQIALPDGVEVRGNSLKVFGSLSNCGDGGSYFVGKLVKSSISENKLESFFENKSINSVDKNDRIYIVVLSIELEKDESISSNDFISITLQNIIKKEWFNSKIKGGNNYNEKYYLICAIDEGYPPTDFRCF